MKEFLLCLKKRLQILVDAGTNMSAGQKHLLLLSIKEIDYQLKKLEDGK